MKKAVFILLLLVCIVPIIFVFAERLSAQDRTYTILLTGASFASPGNGWFELGCKYLDADPVNRAIGGEAIANTANRMGTGTLYSKEELERIDLFVIMQVHNKDVFDESQLKENYLDYKLPFDRYNYAAAFDYVIKRYISDCYNLKLDPSSKYYNTEKGKPARIVLCTHWHDGRTVYNESVRRLADKWNLPLIEFDRNIGFTKDKRDPETNEQYSLKYSIDKEVIDGEYFGWHPERGEDKYIQQKMATIFKESVSSLLLQSTDSVPSSEL
ncbi:MAG: DUF5040 domain-containing protein [Dysgonomonas sp.]